MFNICIILLAIFPGIFGTAHWLNEDVTDDHLVEGDIALIDVQSTDQISSVVQFGVSSYNTTLWTNKEIPYSISHDFDNTELTVILQAIEEIHNATCVKFIPHKGQINSVVFRKVSTGVGCSSLVGQNGGVQNVNLTHICVKHTNPILHELMHLLGFYHEHSRHDRDEWIEVKIDNIIVGRRTQLFVIDQAETIDYKLPYDYQSITHYPDYAFAINSDEKTIVPKLKHRKIESNGLSVLDIMKINLRYNCTKNLSYDHVKLEEQKRERKLQYGNFRSEMSRIAMEVRNGLVDVVADEEYQISLLHFAAFVGQKETVQLLLDQSANVESRTVQGNTALHIAAGNNQLDVVKLLLHRSANIEARNKHNMTALHLAAYFGHETIVIALLDNFANIEAADLLNETPLHLASRLGFMKVVSILLNSSANVGAENLKFETPLHLAVENRHVIVVELLITNLAIIDAETITGVTPLHLAAKNGHVAIASYLIEHSANIESKDISSNTPLHIAVFFNNFNIVQLLLNCSANVYARISEGRTPLHLAVIKGDEKVLNALLQYSGESNIRDNNGWTPIHFASFRNIPSIASFLIKQGANIEAVEYKRKMTPLHFAAEAGSEQVVAVLLNNSANVNAKDMFENTPLHFAVIYGHQKVAELLINNYADVNAKSILLNRTALHHAAMLGDSEMVRLLISSNADVTAESDLEHRSSDGRPQILKGKTALDFAKISGNIDVINDLQDEQNRINE